jgi:hypothetical protein
MFFVRTFLYTRRIDSSDHNDRQPHHDPFYQKKKTMVVIDAYVRMMFDNVVLWDVTLYPHNRR